MHPRVPIYATRAIFLLKNLYGIVISVLVMGPQETESPPTRGYAFLGIGFEFIFVFLAFTAAGWLCDLYVPWDSGQAGGGILVGLFLGLFGGLWHLYRRSQELQSTQIETDSRSAFQSDRDADTQILSPEKMEELSRDIEGLHKKLGEKLDHS